MAEEEKIAGEEAWGKLKAAKALEGVMQKAPGKVKAEGVRMVPEEVNIGAEGVKVGAEGVKVEAEGVKVETEGVNMGAEGVNMGAEGVNPGAQVNVAAPEKPARKAPEGGKMKLTEEVGSAEEAATDAEEAATDAEEAPTDTATEVEITSAISISVIASAISPILAGMA